MTKLPELSLLDIANDGRHFARKNHMGATEIVDSISGSIVALIKDPNSPPKLVKRTLPNGEEVWMDETLPEHILKHVGPQIPYHPWIIDMICEEIARGVGLIKICEKTGMPSYPTLCRWRRMHPEIDKALEEARRDRAEFHRDKAMDVVEEVKLEEDVPAARLKHEAHKWSAGVDDAKFSPKAKVDVAINAPTMIVVATGIDRRVSVPNTRDVGDTINVTSKIQSDATGAESASISRDSGERIDDIGHSGPSDAPGKS